MVVESVPSKRPGHDRLVDVRVDDHPGPLAEVRRLVGLSVAYRRMEDAETAMTEGNLDAALAIYAESISQQPAQIEFPFWEAVLLAGLSQYDEARNVVAPVFAGANGEGWRELVRRLPAAGILDQAGATELLDRR